MLAQRPDVPQLEAVLELVAATEQHPLVFLDVERVAAYLGPIDAARAAGRPRIPHIDHAVPAA